MCEEGEQGRNENDISTCRNRGSYAFVDEIVLVYFIFFILGTGQCDDIRRSLGNALTSLCGGSLGLHNSGGGACSCGSGGSGGGGG